MKTLLATLMIAVVYGSPIAAGTPPGGASTDPVLGKPVPQFTAQLVDVSVSPPKQAAFDSHKTSHDTAYIFVGTTCPATNAYVDRFKQIEQTYRPKGIDFIYIYPNSNDTSDAKLGFHKEKGFTGHMIDDQGAKLAKLFQAQRTSELFVADKKGTVVYHGAVDDSRDPNAVKQRYLATALDELLASKPITTAYSQVFA